MTRHFIPGRNTCTRSCEECGSTFTLYLAEANLKGRRRLRFCSKRCSKLGSRNPRWKEHGAKTDAGRSRARSMYSDIGPCQLCGNSKSERHHIDGNTFNNDRSNILITCRRCHMTCDGRLEFISKVVSRMGCTASAEKRRFQ